jgi:hypothetical protein
MGPSLSLRAAESKYNAALIMMKKKPPAPSLTPQQRAYRLGLRRGMTRARAAIARDLDHEDESDNTVHDIDDDDAKANG